MTVDTLYSAAMGLPPEGRAALAEKLLDSLDGPQDPEIEAAWIAEAKRRIAEIDRGEAELIPAEEVFRTLRIRNQP